MVEKKNVGVIQRRKKYPESYDEYLEAIYRISLKNPKGWVKNKEIAESLKVKPSSVSNMLSKLRETDLIEWKPRGGIRLSKRGRKRAKDLITNHIIIEIFLDRILHLEDKDEIERITCNLEHYFTQTLKEKFMDLMALDSDDISNVDNLILEDKFPKDIKIKPIYSENEVVRIIRKIKQKLENNTKEKVKGEMDNLLEKGNFKEFSK